MNVKKILTNAVLIVIAGGLIGLCIATHVYNELLASGAPGVTRLDMMG